MFDALALEIKCVVINPYFFLAQHILYPLNLSANEIATNYFSGFLQADWVEK
jgi:hypothetical protein